MDEKTKLFVFAKKEIALLFIFMVLVAIISFVLGVKIGKQYSYETGGITAADRQKIDLMSAQEEAVDDLVKSSGAEVSEDEKQVLDNSDAKLREELDKLNKSGDKYIGTDAKEEIAKVEVKEETAALPADSNVEVENDRMAEESSLPKEMLDSLKKKDELSGKYTIQLGSYRKLEDAEKFADGFRVRGYNPIINETNLKERGVWFRISLGIFGTASEAKNYIIKEKSLFQGTDYVIGKFD
ncbi:MAG: hypothetical protein A2504_09195 [Bdellovibrionales bacterium RIFOXYD12_FULL_39_22]|nr:MAG: hypothetical protein A2385_17355 [Bdellovibrionales bacterium RIFOXYB1_FULL_39_21]OFZ41083.1 MAG: hypothetical protein A2485_00280 [Bdellovibrionales bacterium RIFOXYC12_FULL_39_17]OFZ50296.1 MAG: hypothetical protein A2404_07595 [Bdellovibrionales bacterium RIFOXYC1_FULL_39_130]OFZ71816.1 MAG: hypothetical protein A2451_09620 [Bdellovibrionales bacterium RIFOXYC2_FULL_39_8]OFZ75097.1 MAG: hypothetical protein A2560_16290 [Bdellovibrionales bacterium RIFOXYD1_FULL_39_84]OFZ92261.1 MAG: